MKEIENKNLNLKERKNRGERRSLGKGSSQNFCFSGDSVGSLTLPQSFLVQSFFVLSLNAFTCIQGLLSLCLEFAETCSDLQLEERGIIRYLWINQVQAIQIYSM